MEGNSSSEEWPWEFLTPLPVEFLTSVPMLPGVPEWTMSPDSAPLRRASSGLSVEQPVAGFLLSGSFPSEPVLLENGAVVPQPRCPPCPELLTCEHGVPAAFHAFLLFDKS